MTEFRIAYRVGGQRHAVWHSGATVGEATAKVLRAHPNASIVSVSKRCGGWMQPKAVNRRAGVYRERRCQRLTTDHRCAKHRNQPEEG